MSEQDLKALVESVVKTALAADKSAAPERKEPTEWSAKFDKGKLVLAIPVNVHKPVFRSKSGTAIVAKSGPAGSTNPRDSWVSVGTLDGLDVGVTFAVSARKPRT